MALIWLVLIGLIAFAYHANSRLRRLEERFESELGGTYHCAPAWAEPEVPEPVAAPASTTPAEEIRDLVKLRHYYPDTNDLIRGWCRKNKFRKMSFKKQKEEENNYFE